MISYTPEYIYNLIEYLNNSTESINKSKNEKQFTSPAADLNMEVLKQKITSNTEVQII